MIINNDVRPKETIFYISAVIYKILRVASMDTTQLYSRVDNEIADKLDYSVFLLSIDFLFLLNKINVNNKGELTCI
ncbi:ABC-three component system middle component 6 [Lactococcus lactis]|uniref:ABC-three component system middle component 6 n=1 Tax=Lactococcus lactis TaxID=1358 RepID=UPI003D0DE3D4